MDTLIPEKEKRKQKVKRLIIASTIIFVIIAILMVIAHISGGSIKRSQLSFCVADTGNVENTVSAHGKVVPAYEEVVTSPVSTRILEIFHREGDIVNAGDALLRLDTQSAEGEVRRLGDELAVRRNTTVETGLDNRTYLTNLEMQIEAKRMAVEELHEEVSNERRLDSIGSGTGDRVRQAELAWKTGVIELEQLRKQLENEKLARQARLESSRLQESIQSRTLDEARRVLSDAGVRAPRRATLTYINSNIGGSVSPGEKLAVLSDLDSFRISGELPEGEADKVIAGGEVEVKLGNTRLRGRIGSVTPQATNGMIGFNVLLHNAGDSRLRAGIRVDLNLICGLKENVVRISNGPYFHGAGTYILFVANPDGESIEARKVILGDSNFDYVEVITGLKAGEKVVTSHMSEYKNQKKIKLKD